MVLPPSSDYKSGALPTKLKRHISKNKTMTYSNPLSMSYDGKRVVSFSCNNFDYHPDLQGSNCLRQGYMERFLLVFVSDHSATTRANSRKRVNVVLKLIVMNLGVPMCPLLLKRHLAVPIKESVYKYHSHKSEGASLVRIYIRIPFFPSPNSNQQVLFH